MCSLFNMKVEIATFLKFCQSDIVRFLFLMTDEALTTLAREVPWFEEWKTADGLLDFNDDVNKQLCTLFKLTKPEATYVTQAICTLDASRHRKGALNKLIGQNV